MIESNTTDVNRYNNVMHIFYGAIEFGEIINGLPLVVVPSTLVKMGLQSQISPRKLCQNVETWILASYPTYPPH